MLTTFHQSSTRRSTTDRSACNLFQMMRCPHRAIVAVVSKYESYLRTSSALNCRFGGMVRLICLAAFRLMVNAILSIPFTGKSLGFNASKNALHILS
jgi:hypothetical protein